MKRFVSMFLVIALLFLAVPSVGFAAVTDEELEGYLNENNITREQLDWYLEYYGDMTVDDFVDLTDLGWYVWVTAGNDPDGTPYIEYILGNYGITYDELVALLAEDGKSLDDFTFIEELDEYLWDKIEWPEEPYYEGLFQEFGFTYQELDNLFTHLYKIAEAHPETVDKLISLAERMEAFDGFESSSELTAEEIAELFSIGTELIDVLKLDAKFYLAKPGEQKPISFKDLLNLEKLEGYDLLVVLHDLEGNKLADFIITAELFNGNTLGKVGKDVENIGTIVEESAENKPAPTPPAKTKAEKEEKVAKVDKTAPAKQSEPKKENTSSKKVTKTVDGAKMPKTATDYPMYTFIGLGMTLVGFILFRRFKMAS